MKALITRTILLTTLLAGCTTNNPDMEPVLTFTDGPAPSVSADGATGGSSREPVVEEDGSTDDVRQIHEVDGSTEPDAEPGGDTGFEPEADAGFEPEADAGLEGDSSVEPEADAEIEPEADAEIDAGSEPEADAEIEPEADATPSEPDALPMGCMADPGACPAGHVCSFETHECVVNCGDPEVVGYMVCSGATPVCIPPGPHGFAPRCGQCLDSSYCSLGYHCNDAMCVPD